jgi:hypothetical protein
VVQLLILTAALVGCGASTAPRSDVGEPDDAGYDAALARDGGTRADASSDAREPSDSGGVTYEAISFATALSRFAIAKRDPARGVCASVLFVFPTEATTPGLALPDRWSVQNAWRAPISTCPGGPFAEPPDVETASAVTGTGSWVGEPCVVDDVDLALEFTDGSTERIDVEDLPTGC